MVSGQFGFGDGRCTSVVAFLGLSLRTRAPGGFAGYFLFKTALLTWGHASYFPLQNGVFKRSLTVAPR